MPVFSRDNIRPHTPTIALAQSHSAPEQPRSAMKAATRERTRQRCRAHCTEAPSTASPTEENTDVTDLARRLQELQQKFKEVQLDNHSIRKQLQASNQRISIVMANLDAEQDTNRALQSQLETAHARHVDVLEENHVLRLQLRHNSTESQASIESSQSFESPLEMALLRRESEDSQQQAEELEEQVYTLIEELEDRERDMEDMRCELETLRMYAGSTASSNGSEVDPYDQRHSNEIVCEPCQLRSSVEEVVASATLDGQRRRRNALIPEDFEPQTNPHLFNLHTQTHSVEPSMPSTPTDDVSMEIPPTSSPTKNKQHHHSSSRDSGKANKKAKSSLRVDGSGLQSAKKLPRR